MTRAVDSGPRTPARALYPAAVPARFLTPDQVCEELAISRSQLYALIRRGDLAAVKVGGRGQWRVERAKLEDYIARLYDATREFIEQHPFPGPEDSAGEDDAEPLP